MKAASLSGDVRIPPIRTLLGGAGPCPVRKRVSTMPQSVGHPAKDQSETDGIDQNKQGSERFRCRRVGLLNKDAAEHKGGKNIRRQELEDAFHFRHLLRRHHRPSQAHPAAGIPALAGESTAPRSLSTLRLTEVR